MKKTFVSTLLIILSSLFLTACIGQNTNQNQNQNNEQAPQMQNREQVMNEWQKMADALVQGKAVRCQIRHRETNQTGEYFMKGENIRYMLRNSDNPEQNGAFISDGEYVYSWSEQNKQGMKFKIEAQEGAEEQVEEAVPSENNVPDLSDESAWQGFEEQGFSVECNIEEVADSQFVPPTDVEFMDFSQMMQQMQTGSGNQPEFDPEQYRGMMQ